MNISNIKQFLVEKLNIDTNIIENSLQPLLQVKVNDLIQVATFLHENEHTYFDMLSCITAIDNGKTLNSIDVVYNLYSIPFNLSISLSVSIERNSNDGVPSLSHIWKTAEWHEREAYDLVGIKFKNHPDLRRILLPNNWDGHPLQKDYSLQEKYHGIKVKY
ncbi:MAG: NADH-quinone oxidoreductase subunit C [Candidatus Dojkabacteria bacterium]